MGVPVAFYPKIEVITHIQMTLHPQATGSAGISTTHELVNQEKAWDAVQVLHERSLLSQAEVNLWHLSAL